MSWIKNLASPYALAVLSLPAFARKPNSPIISVRSTLNNPAMTSSFSFDGENVADAPSRSEVGKAGDVNPTTEGPADLESPGKLIDAREMADRKAQALLVTEVIHEWASGSSMDLVEFRSAWLRANLPVPVFLSARSMILPVFEDLVKFFAEAARREKELKDQEKLGIPGKMKEEKVEGTAARQLRRDVDHAFLPCTQSEGAWHGNNDIIMPEVQPQTQPGWTSSVLFPVKPLGSSKKRPTSQDMLDIARVHLASSAVAHVAKLHAHLITNGICGEFTRTRCLFSLLEACSFLICSKQVGVPSVLHNTALHVRSIKDGVLFVAHIAGYAAQTLRTLSPVLAVLPRPISIALSKSHALQQIGLSAESYIRDPLHSTDFPTSIITEWYPAWNLQGEDDFRLHEALSNADSTKVHTIYHKIMDFYELYWGDDDHPSTINTAHIFGTKKGS